MKKKNAAPVSVKVSMRLSTLAHGHVQGLARATGWSEAKAATFIVETGGAVLWATAHSARVTIRRLQEARQLVAMAKKRHEVEQHAAATVALARKTEAAARRAMTVGAGK